MKDNPYVGPRPCGRGDRYNFYGRDREARELRALIVAERDWSVFDFEALENTGNERNGEWYQRVM